MTSWFSGKAVYFAILTKSTVTKVHFSISIKFVIYTFFFLQDRITCVWVYHILRDATYQALWTSRPIHKLLGSLLTEVLVVQPVHLAVILAMLAWCYFQSYNTGHLSSWMRRDANIRNKSTRWHFKCRPVQVFRVLTETVYIMCHLMFFFFFLIV